MPSPRKLRLLPVAAALALLAGPAFAASISGTITYEGKVPSLPPPRMDADPGCAKKHGAALPANELLVLGSGNTVGNVLVRVKKAPAGSWPAATKAATLDQQGCQYKPHVLAVRTGQQVKILNSDGLLHNVHALPAKNSEFNRAMPASVTETTVTFDKVEDPFKIKCDVHPWMGAWVVVLDHPFFDVTDPDGKFTLSNVPAGTYEIEAWHEKLPGKTVSVTVTGSETKTVDFTLSPPRS
jgi:plastocyanin